LEKAGKLSGWEAQRDKPSGVSAPERPKGGMYMAQTFEEISAADFFLP
jgi:hypothetical protein